MVFFNWATMQMAAKIVYYGPGLCGKTTNLSFIYSKTAPGSRGEMVSLETETDRTLFFDLLPLEVGKVGGFRTRLQLYTVPGQVFYNTTRKLVLKGVDGIVFVADSQRPMAEANLESLQNLEENLRELGLELATLPMVLQYNKRDLKNIADVDELNAALNPEGSREFFEAVAVRGDGVFETLKAITKSTLKALRRRMAAQETTTAAPAPAPEPPPRAFDAQALSAAAVDALDAATTGTAATAAAADGETRPGPAELPAAEELAVAEEAGEELAGEPGELPAAEELAEAEEVAEAAEVAEAEAPGVAEEAVAGEAAPSSGPAAPEDEEAPVEFATTADAREPEEQPEVRHVKVTSSLDILAELESLRKASTSRPEGYRRAPDQMSFDIDSLLQGSLNSKQEVKRRIKESVGGAFESATRCLVRIELVDADGIPISEVAPVEVELKRDERLRQLSLSLTVDLLGE